MTAPHKHAEVLRAIADGKEVEYWNIRLKCWTAMDVKLGITPLTTESCVGWRIKPDTIKIGNHEFPKPMTEAPDYGTTYYLADLSNVAMFGECEWRDDSSDHRFLSIGLCHKSEEAAIAHAEALIAISQGK